MSTKGDFTIGQFAKACGISTHTLRFYDKVGILEPRSTDPSSGYRYYSIEDIAKIRVIQNLRDMSYSIKEIHSMFTKTDLTSQIQLMRRKRDKLSQHLEMIRHALLAMDKRIESMEKLSKKKAQFDYQKIELRYIPARQVLYTRKMSSYSGRDMHLTRFTELLSLLAEQMILPTSNMMIVHHSIKCSFKDEQTPAPLYDREHVDLEVCVPVQKVPKGGASLRIIPPGPYLTLLYRTSFDGRGVKQLFPLYYPVVVNWLSENGYVAVGCPIEELLVDLSLFLNPDTLSDFIIEVQVPVKKI